MKDLYLIKAEKLVSTFNGPPTGYEIELANMYTNLSIANSLAALKKK